MHLANMDADPDVKPKDADEAWSKYTGIELLDLTITREQLYSWGVVGQPHFHNIRGIKISNCCRCFCVLRHGSICPFCPSFPLAKAMYLGFTLDNDIGSVAFNPYFLSCMFHTGDCIEADGKKDYLSSVNWDADIIHIEQPSNGIYCNFFRMLKELPIFYGEYYSHAAKHILTWKDSTVLKGADAVVLKNIIHTEMMQNVLIEAFNQAPPPPLMARHGQQECVGDYASLGKRKRSG